MFPFNTGRYLRISIIGVSWLFPAVNTLAAETGRTIENPLITLGKLAVALVIVLVVFWIFARVMRQFQGFQGGIHHGLKIVGTLSVGQRERVVVVQAGDEQLVLGVTSTQINTLHVMGKPLTQETAISPQSDFRTKLSAALKREVPAE